MPPSKAALRNAVIARAHTAGVPIPWLATLFELSNARVVGIVVAGREPEETGPAREIRDPARDSRFSLRLFRDGE